MTADWRNPMKITGSPKGTWEVLMFAGVSFGVLLTVGEAHAQDVVEIGDAPACPECRVVAKHVATLGGSATDSVLLRANSKLAVDSRGRFYVGQTFTAGIIAMFSASGELVRTFGREGEGPGEFGVRMSHVTVGRGDTIHVFERNRHTRLEPGLGGLVDVRTLSVPVWEVYALRDGRLVGHYPLYGAGETVTPLHLFDRTGEVVRTFSRSDGPIDYYTELHMAIRVLAESRSGKLWIGRPNAYRVELWDTSGTHELNLSRDADWFRPWAVPRDPLEEPPRPTLFGLMEHESGELWTAIQVADGEWRPHPESGREMTFEELARWDYDDTVIEVLDPEEARLVTRSRFDHLEVWLPQPNGDGPMLFYDQVVDPTTGIVRFEVWRVEIARPLP